MAARKNLSNEEKEQILKLYNENKSYRAVAKSFNISITAVKKIVAEFDGVTITSYNTEQGIQTQSYEPGRFDIIENPDILKELIDLTNPTDPVGLFKTQSAQGPQALQAEQLNSIDTSFIDDFEEDDKFDDIEEDEETYKLKKYAADVANSLNCDKLEALDWLGNILEMIDKGADKETIMSEIDKKKSIKSNIRCSVEMSYNDYKSDNFDDIKKQKMTAEQEDILKRLNNINEYIQGHPMDSDGELWYDRDGISRYIEKNMYKMTEYAKDCRIKAYEDADKKRFDDLRKQANDVYDLIQMNIDKSNNINILNEIGLKLSHWYVDIFNEHCAYKESRISHKILPCRHIFI